MDMEQEEKKVRVAITHGDTNGVGYELIFKTFAEQGMLELCMPIIYGSPKLATFHRKMLNIPAQFTIISKAEDASDNKVNMLTCIEDEVKVDVGTHTPESEQAAQKAVDRAVEDYKNHLFDVLVTAPAANRHKQLSDGNDKGTLRMLIGERMMVGFATSQLPIKDVPGVINTDLITDKLKTMHLTLKRDFRITNPRIAVLALNPQEDPDAPLSDEDLNAIYPAVEAMSNENKLVFGPFSADKFFGALAYEHYDAVLAMYYDQGAVPFFTIEGEKGVEYTAGTDIIHTSPDNDPDYPIAGQGKADEAPMRNAIYTAIDIFRNRANYDEAHENPLPKLYHEKKDESEKVRFAIPKKKEPDANKEE